VARGLHRAPAALLHLPERRAGPGLQRRTLRLQERPRRPARNRDRHRTNIYDAVHCRLDQLEFAFTHTHAYGENYFSFVNGQYTNDGGTHQSAFREGILKGVNEFSKGGFAGEDVRDGLIGAIAIKLQDPVFESQTKNKLGSPRSGPGSSTRSSEQVVLWLHKNPQAADKLLEKVKQNQKRPQGALGHQEGGEGSGPRRSPSASRSSSTARST
jgi:DNA gyrase/topoisomerase IV subunit B